ncbi:MAG: UDP-N-acetylmuramoyl-tripeptide--D-alanyl-D-alanine ligase [Pseudomonadota bacterium]
MSDLWTSREAMAATGGTTLGDWRASGVSIDSRSLVPGDLFVALVVERDGHAYVADALAKGAAAAVVARPVEGIDRDRQLLVDDTQRALEHLARAARERSAADVIGITGSVGKTGCKAALARGLALQGATHASGKSHNNHWGVPLSLAQLPATARFGVFELGMSRAGEIRSLAAQVRPHGALITAIAPAHIEFFADESGIAEAKAEIFEGVRPEGFAVVPADSPHTPLLVARARAAGIQRIVTFGEAGDVRALAVEPDADGSRVEVDLAGRRLSMRVGLPGEHWAHNALGLLAVVDTLGADVEAFALSLADLESEAGRGRRVSIRLADGEALLLDDSYNANPTSMRAAISVLAMARGRKLAALGAMKELGADSQARHAELAAPLVEADVARVFTVGAEMAALETALPATLRGGHVDRAADLVQPLRAELRPGDTLLVKGSLASGMGFLVDSLMARAA